MNRQILSLKSVGLGVVVIWILFASMVSAGQDAIRIVIDTRALTLKVMQDDHVALAFSNISIGRYGAVADRRRGDNTTPLGHFTIAWITDETPFHRFFGFRFPSIEYAERAFQAGDLDKNTRDKIRQAVASGRLPPQNTILGGYLGIHGLGRGDKKIHERYNWTNGCVALTNGQIDLLSKWLKVGTPVDVR